MAKAREEAEVSLVLLRKVASDEELATASSQLKVRGYGSSTYKTGIEP